MNMSVSQEHKELVDVHGHRVERMIQVGEKEKANWMMTRYMAQLGDYGYSLTKSEKRALRAIKDTFNIKRLRRPNTGVDFIFGNVGFEVKSIDWYRLSDNQKRIIDMLEATFIIVSDGNGPYILKVLE